MENDKKERCMDCIMHESIDKTVEKMLIAKKDRKNKISINK
jgi:hypothetical protein